MLRNVNLPRIIKMIFFSNSQLFYLVFFFQLLKINSEVYTLQVNRFEKPVYIYINQANILKSTLTMKYMCNKYMCNKE